jgi:hypothetical protein
MERTGVKWPQCPGCGEPIGVYEPLLRVTADVGAEATAWLHLPAERLQLETLWHLRCAEADGIDGG